MEALKSKAATVATAAIGVDARMGNARVSTTSVDVKLMSASVGPSTAMAAPTVATAMSSVMMASVVTLPQ